MHSPKTILDANNFYDFAWLTTKYEPYSLVWHNGETSGIKSVIQIIPEAKLGIVVLTNMSDTPLPEALGKKFVDLYFGNPLKDWSAESLKATKAALSQEAEIPDIHKEKPLPLEAYAGKYVNPVYGEIVISIEGENLVFAIGPKQSKIVLTHWNRDTFLFSVPDFMDEGGFVHFQIDPLGKAYKFVDDTIGDFDRIAD